MSKIFKLECLLKELKVLNKRTSFLKVSTMADMLV